MIILNAGSDVFTVCGKVHSLELPLPDGCGYNHCREDALCLLRTRKLSAYQECRIRNLINAADLLHECLHGGKDDLAEYLLQIACDFAEGFCLMQIEPTPVIPPQPRDWDAEEEA